MNKKLMPLLGSVLLVLTGMTGFSVYQYIVSQRQTGILQAELTQVQDDISQLELIRDNLSEDLSHARKAQQALVLENTGLKSLIKDDQTKFAMLETAIVEAQNDVDMLNGQISIARQENAALAGQIEGLRIQLAAVAQEKDHMAETLNSVDELKRAIRALKRTVRTARRSSPMQVMVDDKKKVTKIILGNKGYIIKNGKVTAPARVKIEVQASTADN